MWKVLLVFLLLTSPIAGQVRESGRFEVSGGHSFLGSSEIVDGYAAGWIVAGTWNRTRWFGVGIEASGNSLKQDVGLLDVNAGFLSVLIGPRISTTLKRLRPFTQLLFGSTKVDLAATSWFPVLSTGKVDDRHPTLQVGGGVDIPIEQDFRVRIGFDYRRVFAIRPLNQHRVITAIVYTLPSLFN